MAIGLMVYRGFYFRAFDLSGILQSGFWFIGDLVIGLWTYRGFVIGLMVIGLLAIGLMSCSRNHRLSLNGCSGLLGHNLWISRDHVYLGQKKKNIIIIIFFFF